MTNETTFENVQLLDKVFNIGLGWGTVIQRAVENGKTSTFWVVFKEYGHEIHFTASGTVTTNSFTATNQTLFWDEVKIVAPVKPVAVPPKDTLVLVDGKLKRYSTGVLSESGKLLCYHNGANSITVDSPNMIVGWETWEVVI